MVTGDVITPGFVAFVITILLAIAVIGALAMYYVATRPSLLDRVRELAGVSGHE
ncbi:hypothetical protein [Vulcanisaeta souniana]|uniref:hypothetical protein n=1 Tax=Vulcanisaeta souniana TaxID=164452 RepID=UPI000AD6C3AE|nr:hypothetical protein [Vulcanisaeta souniana]